MLINFFLITFNNEMRNSATGDITSYCSNLTKKLKIPWKNFTMTSVDFQADEKLPKGKN